MLVATMTFIPRFLPSELNVPNGRKRGYCVIAVGAGCRYSRGMLKQNSTVEQKDASGEVVVRRVAILAMPDVHTLDVAGPFDIFERAAKLVENRSLVGGSTYTVEILTTKTGPLGTSTGLQFLGHRSFRRVRGGIDTLLVVAGQAIPSTLIEPSILRWLQRMAPQVRRLCSICAGAFVLAAAGLLDGRRATTHWGFCQILASRYPHIEVDPDPIFVRDGNVYTTAGVTAGMDLALALVEEDYGHEVAVKIARDLVLFMRRPGGQSQFSSQLLLQAADREPLRELLGWMADHLNQDLSVEALANQVNMSPRHFARVFAQEVGVTPARFVEKLRLEAARRRLEESSQSVEVISVETGFGSAESMRRSFLRHLRVTPTDYRSRFQLTLVH